MIAAYYAAQFVAAPWLGKLSDRFGRRPILIISQIGTIASYLLFIFAAPLGDFIGVTLGISGGLVMIYVARLLDGVTGGNVSVAEAYASDISDEKSRAHALGLIGGAGGLGHILGPALAVALSGFSLIAPMIGALAMSGVTLLLTILLLDEPIMPETRAAKHSAAPEIPVARLLADRSVTLLLSIAFIAGLYIATLFSSFSLYADRVLFPGEPAEVIAQNVNLIIMLVGVAAAISQIFLIAPLVRRWGERRLVVIGSVLLLGSAIGISSGSLVLVLVAMLAYALGFAIMWPSLQAILSRIGPKESAGKRLGLFQSAFSLAFIAAPLVAGLLFETLGAQAVFYNGALLMGVATALSVISLHRSVPASEENSDQTNTSAEPGGLLQRFHH